MNPLGVAAGGSTDDNSVYPQLTIDGDTAAKLAPSLTIGQTVPLQVMAKVSALSADAQKPSITFDVVSCDTGGEANEAPDEEQGAAAAMDSLRKRSQMGGEPSITA